jgi:uncharacterized protein
MADPVTDVIQSARRIAVVGASDDPEKASNEVMRTLLDAGYQVVPVNPKVDEVHGVPAVASLAEVEGPIDIVDVFRRDEHAPAVAEEAVAAGAGTVWLQQGITSHEARRISQDAGVGFVEDLCLGATVRQAGLAP